MHGHNMTCMIALKQIACDYMVDLHILLRIAWPSMESTCKQSHSLPSNQCVSKLQYSLVSSSHTTSLPQALTLTPLKWQNPT